MAGSRRCRAATGIAPARSAAGLKELSPRRRSVGTAAFAGGRRPQGRWSRSDADADCRSDGAGRADDAGRSDVAAALDLQEPAPAGGGAADAWATRSATRVVGELLQASRSSACRPTARPARAPSHPDRDAQFGYINAEREGGAWREGQPVISVDTKKKELVGDFKNAGREWRPQGEPEDGPGARLPDQGVGPGRAVRRLRPRRQRRLGQRRHRPRHRRLRRATIRRWWQEMGARALSRRAHGCSITADGGGSNGSRVRLWKRELQRLADETRHCHHGLSLAARHQQVEQDRAPPVLLHHHELARQAAGQLPASSSS